jgi:hypothetical protein
LECGPVKGETYRRGGHVWAYRRGGVSAWGETCRRRERRVGVSALGRVGVFFGLTRTGGTMLPNQTQPCSSRTEATAPSASALDCRPTIPPLCGGAGILSDPCYQLRKFVSEVCGSRSSNRGLFGIRNRGAFGNAWRELENDRPGRSQSR